MPFTPFHFGPSACLALPLQRRLDLPTFLLVNVAVDLEPLLVMSFDLPLRLHGPAHTLLGATLIGMVSGAVLFRCRRPLQQMMTGLLPLPYAPTLRGMVLTGILGACFHILLDAPLYVDITPFAPFSDANPLLGVIDGGIMYTLTALSYIPALLLYLWVRLSAARR